jgi:hypothetical protein
MYYTPRFMIEQLEITGEVSMTYSDPLTVNRLVIRVKEWCRISLGSQVTMNTLEAVGDLVQLEEPVVDVDISGGTVAKVINISGAVMLRAASSLTIAEGVIVYLKAPFSKLPPGLWHPEMQFVFHAERIEVAFAGDVVSQNLVWEAFRGEMTSSFQYLLDKIVLVNRMKRAIVGRNLYV